jgi:hypothetical protein
MLSRPMEAFLSLPFRLSLWTGNCTDWITFQALGPADGSAEGEDADGWA